MGELRYQIRLSDLAVHERPQERLERLGPAALSETELLAMFLRKGTRKVDVIGLASAILAETGSLSGLTRLTTAEFRKFHGIGKVRSLQLTAMVEIVRRMWTAQGEPSPVLDAPEKVAAHLAPRVLGLAVEKFWVLSLNTRNRLVRLDEVTSGTATASLVHPREVFRSAIGSGATAVICVHNHPSGDPSPSQADLRVTRQLVEAAQALDIQLLDHVIVGVAALDPSGLGYYSFREAGLIRD